MMEKLTQIDWLGVLLELDWVVICFSALLIVFASIAVGAWTFLLSQ